MFPPPANHKSTAASPRRRGFALLITVTLLAFLVLLLVSLATLTRVETQVATNSQNLGQARQNALMALNIAIGQLQKFAGPDQRVTTTADLLAAKDASGTNYPPAIAYADPNGTNRRTVTLGSKYWTAAWGNGLNAISYTVPPQAIQPTSGSNAHRGITPLLLNWLVSGNESTALSPNGTQGGVTADTTPPSFSPSLTLTTPLTFSTTASDTLTFSDAKNTKGVLLVGPASTSDGTTLGKTASIAAGNYVVAPLVNITVPTSSIPGLGSASTTTPVGKYAYWVGDEGVKARVNQKTGFQKTGQSSDEINSFITAQRSALEFMDSDAANTTPIGPINYDITNPTILTQIGSLKTASQLPCLGNIFATVAKTRFHNLTAYSYGVLSDTYAGGLKKDLTADITDPSSKGNNLAGDRNNDTDSIFTARIAGTTDPGLPRWNMIRNWARTNPADPNTSAGNKIDPTSPAARSAGIYPNVIVTSLGLDYYFDPLTYSTPPAFPPDPANLGMIASARLMMAFYPLVVLQNPYPVTLAGKDYDVIMRVGPNAHWQVEIDNNEDSNYKHLADFNLNTITLTAYPAAVGSPAPESYFRFRIKGEDIPPGQRHMYVLKSSFNNTTYIPGVSAPELERMVDGVGLTRKVLLQGPLITDPNIQSPNSRVRMKADMSSSRGGVGLVETKGSVILTEADAFPNSTWANVTSTSGMTKWYQALFDIYLMPRRYTYGGVFFTPIGKAVTVVIQPDGTEQEVVSKIAAEIDSGGISIGDKISSRVNSKATGAFRMSPVLDGSDWYSSNYQVGLPFPHTTRYLATGSLRAPYIQGSYEELGRPTPNGTIRNIANSYGAVIMGCVIAGNTQEDSGGATHPGIGRSGEGFNQYSIGFGGGPATSANTPQTEVVLWDLLDSPDRLLSLGQLQHAPLARYGFQSSYLFANSYADMRINRDELFTTNIAGANAEVTAPNGTGYPLYDSSWLLNRSIWDRFFVSGVPSVSGSATVWTQSKINSDSPLPNARMTYYSRNNSPPKLNDIQYSSGTNRAYDLAADNLLVSGDFNINSTSEEAWRAILASTYRIPLNAAYANTDDNVDTAIPYPRFTHNLTVSGDPLYKDLPVTMRPDPLLTASDVVVSGSPGAYRSVNSNGTSKLNKNFFTGNRGLYLNNPELPANNSATAVVNELARSIVNEIRQRGPFLSLADFINRPLTPGTEQAGIKGVLQAGIDNMDPNVAQVNPWIYSFATGNLRNFAGKDGNGNFSYAWNLGPLNEHAAGGLNSGGGYSVDYPREVYRTPGSMAPKQLTQADLLSSLGPMLSARSDTFTIRTYGEAINPANGESTGKVWCEAVVQRVPDYIDQTDLNIKTLGNATPVKDLSANSTNQLFGRKFKIVSFRWLSPSDI